MEAATAKKPGCKRLCIVAAVAAYVLLGIPVWWHTTSIPRPPLPHSQMQQADVSFANRTLLLPVAVHVYIVEPDEHVNGAQLTHTIQQHLVKHQPANSPHISQVTVIVESQGTCQQSQMTPLHPNQHLYTQHPQPTAWSLPCLHISKLLANFTKDAAAFSDAETAGYTVDSMLHQALLEQGAETPGQYVLFVLPRASRVAATSGRVFVGRHRHAWMWVDADSDASGSSKKGSTLEHGVLNMGLPVLAHMLFPWPGREAVQAAKKLPMSAAGQALLLFTLANGAAAVAPADERKQGQAGSYQPAGYFRWRFGEFEAAYVQPLTNALSMLLRFNIQSQVRLHTNSRVTPKWSKQQQAFLLRPKQLPYFIDSDWNLEFGLDASVGSTGSTFGGTSFDDSVATQGSTHSQGEGQHSTCSVDGGSQGSCPWPSPPSGSTKTAGSNADAEQQYTPAHVLHMVLYVPPVPQRPLRVFQPGNGLHGTNSFWMPSWGVVHIQSDMEACPAVNHGTASTEQKAEDARHGDASGDANSSSSGAGADAGSSMDEPSGSTSIDSSNGSATDSSSGCKEATKGDSKMESSTQGLLLSEADMHSFAESMVAGVRVMLGLPAGPQLPSISAGNGSHSKAKSSSSGAAGSDVALQAHVVASDAGIAAWEVDLLVRSRTAADISEAARVLGSFSRLARKLPNLAMPDLIGDHVAWALDNLKQAAAATATGDYQKARAAALAAHGAAEAAFSHPAILAQLSFPDSHKIGVYVPFFFPALLPVAAALVSEVKRYLKRRRAYQFSIAGSQAVSPGTGLEELDKRVMLQALQERDVMNAAMT